MSRRGVLLLLATCLIVWTAPPVAAHDGMVPVFGPVFIGASGKYHVVRNITAPGPILTIGPAATDVEIDLNGFTLTETSGAAAVVSVPGPGPDHLVLQNGILAGGTSCLDIPVGFAVPLRKVVIDRIKCHDTSGPGIHLGEVVSAVIRKSEISSVGTAGGEAILWDGIVPGKNGTIEDNVIRAAPQGILITVCSSVAILSNRLEGLVAPGPPFGEGIELVGCAGALLAENTIEEASSDGISFRSVQKSKVYDNVIARSGCNGIFLDAASIDNLLLNNAVSGNGFPATCPGPQPGGDGILCDGDFNFFERNVINSNARFGLHLSGPTSAPANPGLSCGNMYGGNMTATNFGPIGPCFAAAAGLPPDFCDNSTAAACGGVGAPANLSATLNGKPGFGLY